MSLVNRHNALYFLVGVILVGLITVQLYWVKKTVDVEKKTIHRALKNDFDKLAAQLEEDAYCFVLQSKSFISQHEGVYVAKYKLDGSPYENGDLLDTINMYNLFEIGGDTEILNYPTIRLENFSATLDMNFQYAFEGVMDKSAYMYRELTEENMAKVLDKKLSIDSALSTTKIKDGVISVLQKNGLDTSFKMYVTKEADTTPIYKLTNSDHKGGMLIESKFFDNEVNSPHYLIIDIPQPYKQIIQSIGTMLISSIIIILILIGTYTYFVKTIINQRKLSELKNAFINNMTHEFRTPITNINLAVDNWRSAKTNNEFYFNIIEEENKHLEKNVEQILGLTTMKHHEDNKLFTDVNVHEVIKNATANYKMQLHNLKGEVLFDLKSQNPFVYGDVSELENMVSNLIDNALKYNKTQPLIKISTKDKNKEIEIQIADNGIGMNRETQKMVFERFYRSNTGDRHDVKGFGLGLSYVKHIIESHKGSVRVKSEEGAGSIFIITLPQTV